MTLIIERMNLRNAVEKAEYPSKTAREKLKDLRKRIKKAARRDRRQYYENLAARAEKASYVGNMKEVYRIARSMAGSRAGAVDLKGVDVNQWTDFFKHLLG